MDVAVRADTDHLAIAGPGITPVIDLDRHAATPPLVHEPAGGLVEVDGVAAREGKPVVVDLEEFSGRPDAEDRAAGPASPVGGGAVDCPITQRSAESCKSLVTTMIALTLCVGGGTDFLNRGPGHRGLVAGKRVGTTT